MEKQFKAYVKKAMESKQETIELLVNLLEHRLDNVVYRMGLAQSRDQGRQLVNHGHILVNKVKTSIPSYQVKKGDVIEVREGSRKGSYFMTLAPQWMQKFESPAWIKLDNAQQKAEIVGAPAPQETGLEYQDLRSIIEFYSR